jgi:antitoxin ParD1/3/4
MKVQLSKDHEEWLRQQVAAGRFSSFEEAIAEAINSLEGNDDDLAWSKPLVEQGLSELDRGEGLDADEVFARVEERLRAKT